MSTPENKPNLNYISLINHFWAVNQEHDFTGNETKLYFFLLHVSNSLGWKNPFKHSLRQIQGLTGLSVNSIKSVQKRLVEAGLIAVKNGVAGDRFNYENKTEYTILPVSKIDTDPDISVSKNDTDKGASVSVPVSAPVSAPVSKIDTINKSDKTETIINYKKSLLSEIKISDYPEINIDYLEIAKSFQQLFRNNLIEAGASPNEVDKAKGTWIDDIRLLIEKDNYTIQDLRDVYQFLQTNKFWKSNILCTSKLREKMGKFKIQMKNETIKGQNNAGQGRDFNELAEIFHKHFNS